MRAFAIIFGRIAKSKTVCIFPLFFAIIIKKKKKDDLYEYIGGRNSPSETPASGVDDQEERVKSGGKPIRGRTEENERKKKP